MPSPWVVGIDGKGKFFDSYSEAAAFLRKAIAVGANVDIGCHQVNWKYHGHNFNKPEELLHPKHNAAYAAHFLVEKFKATKSWSKAIAHYHSHTPEFGEVYLKKVTSILETMKGDNEIKYSSYVNKEGLKISQKSTFVYQNTNANKIKNVSLINNNRPFVEKQGFVKKSRDIIVFSQKVELPTNSVILE